MQCSLLLNELLNKCCTGFDLAACYVADFFFLFELCNLLWGKIIFLLLHQVTITEDEDKAGMIEKVETVEEAQMAKAAEAVESPDPNTVDISDNIVLRKLLVS